MPETVRVVDVGLDSRLAGSEAIYSYLAAPDAAIGQAVFVPLGPRRTLGYILDIREVTEEELGFPLSRLRPTGDVVQGISLPEQTVALVKQVAQQTLAPLPVCLSLVMPPGIRDRLVTRYELTGDKSDGEPLTTPMQETVSILESGPLIERKGKPLPKGSKSILRALIKRGIVKSSSAVAPPSERTQLGQIWRLNPDREKVEKFLAGPGKKKPAQAITLMRLQGSENASFSLEEIKLLGQVSDQTVKALITAGLLEEVDPHGQEHGKAPTPNPHQQSAIDAIIASIQAGTPESYLLFGITGSGKTEVYLRCAEEALRLGKQVLYLVPEIALTAQVIAQLRARFGSSVAVLHSNMSPTERMQSWLRVQSGEAPIVLGPRSALLAPVSRLGMIVMDEEHEASYKQENAPRYHTKRLARWLSQQVECPLVLGSATPSIESYFEAQDGVHKLLELPQRARAARLPQVFIEDLTEVYKDQRPSIFAPKLKEFMDDTLARGEQAILFLNRRAYSPFLVCRDCGHRFQCPSCAVSLAYHRRDNMIRCHHCGYQSKSPETCPECQGERVNTFGVGAEKVEEAVEMTFPAAKVVRLDRDIARKKGALEEVLTAFRSGEKNVLVGTQMVAKGLDFPNVTLVGVIAADISLNIPDFRASERTFQLLTQVAGRAGRGEKAGRVVIQTMSADNVAVQTSQQHDYIRLYEHLIGERRLAQYPPFIRLINVLIMGPDRSEVFEVSTVLGQKLRNEASGFSILGPVNCSLEKLQNNFRRHLLIKAQHDADVSIIGEICAPLATRKTRVIVDVDAYNIN
ncbi:MAG: primosomal protein N' [Armatimonadetes bacterium]|nr:primosomal protein N' [Armatimonadota bacterium]